MIMNALKGHRTSRYFSVLSLLEEMERKHQSSRPKFIPLNRLLYWTCGNDPHVSRECIATVRLIVTIDSWGVNSVDRRPATASALHHIYAIYEGQNISSAYLTIDVRGPTEI
jgi:hypothetical protein